MCENLYSIWQTFGRFADKIKQAVFGKVLIGQAYRNPTDNYAQGGKVLKV